jgi:adenylyltransferase/sulfurtransferase
VPLCAQERDRYDRQLQIPQIGLEGQQRLKAAKVLICGAGGLGSPAAIYLAAAGVGGITIVDHDHVALSNLNRQILHGQADIGRPKVVSAKETLEKINPNLVVNALPAALNAVNAAHVIAGHDVVIDALDNMAARYILNKTAVNLGITLVHGAVNGFEGRVLTVIPGQGACLRCLHRGPVPEAGQAPVIGVTPGVVGAVQAAEAIKYLLGIGQLLVDRLIIYDGLKAKWEEFRVKKNPSCDHCGQPRQGASHERQRPSS